MNRYKLKQSLPTDDVHLLENTLMQTVYLILRFNAKCDFLALLYLEQA
jgi:hypothetical protein